MPPSVRGTVPPRVSSAGVGLSRAIYNGRMRIVALPSRRISAHASRGVEMEFLPRLLGADSARVHLARLTVGGTLGEHPASVPQVFAIIDGEAEVSAGGGVRRRISAGQAAIWEPGEVHQSWALTDLVAVIVETSGTFDLNGHFVEVPDPS